MEIPVVRGQPRLLYSENKYELKKKKQRNILVHFVNWLFHALQTLTNQWLSNYHITMISSNLLSIGSFFFQHRTLDAVWFQLH